MNAQTNLQTNTELKTPTQLLRADHKKVKALFAEFEKTKDASKIEGIFQQVSAELKIHTKVEEKHFYPAAEELLQDEEQKKIFCAKFTVLIENVKHHIQEEEEEMFPKFDKTGADKKPLLKQMLKEKEELKEELGQAA